MSQQRRYRTKIVIPKLQLPRATVIEGELNLPHSPSLTLLHKAMKDVAGEHDGWLDDVYLDCLGHKHPCWLAVHTPDFQRGTGVSVEADGSVTFHYDADSLVQEGRPELIGQARFILDKAGTARALCGEIAQHYSALAVTASLKKLGCKVVTRKSFMDKEGKKGVRVLGKDRLGRVHLAIIDHQGDIFLDLIGFQGDSCIKAERKLRGHLEDFGLQLETTMTRRKNNGAPAGFEQEFSISIGGREDG